MKILISGAGIAGPTLAWWLLEHGFEPVLVERAPRLRTGGYIIDFWGSGFDVAERMGLVPELMHAGYKVREVRMVNRASRKVAGFSAEVFDRLTDGRYVSLPRGELGAMIHARIQDRAETLFDDEILALDDTGDGVNVTFRNAAPRRFDLVIGADGLHSRVRELVFGAEGEFEKYLGYQVAAFETRGYRPRDEDVYVMFTQVGRQISRFSLRDDRTLFLFVLADEAGREAHDARRLLHRRFDAAGWESDGILAAMDATDDLYFDRVSQIRMNTWSRGRVALIGDAAFCVSLLAGQGSALAMTAGYVLAGELRRAQGDYREAFRRYQERLGPFIAKKQQAAEKFAGAFAPRTAVGLFFRNQVTRLLDIPWIADLAIGRDLKDNIALPDYGNPGC
ncbi:MAG TPA: FAD-binding domain [Gammaproteobacteria bacterium]